MDVMTAVLSRRSEHQLTEPAPSDEEFAYLLRAAATAPDHGRLRPWRWILVRGEGRAALGRCFAEACPPPDFRPDRTAAKTHRAPLLATLVFTPVPDHRVPEWEQLAAAGAMAGSLGLLLHARGFGSIWRTGKFTESAQVHRLLRLRPAERLLGWLYIGTPAEPHRPRRRAPDDVTGRISVFTPGLTAGRVSPTRPSARPHASAAPPGR
ncbi:nitroreductase [Streptomyces sp. NBC_01723]|uniref:nitroreductase family protein n=1 Tax=Streptomyces sp. NBC_01723 TaxID=2975921 RepID=UPI002E353F3D|nr:nitroreductase [Streptomyces sp. NBC_01723]